MTKTNAHKTYELGQSIWYDNISRSLLDSGGLQELVDNGVVGVTSNPSIFDKAISGSSDYDSAISKVSDKSDIEIFQALAIEDIAEAADILFPVYESSKAVDGYVSLEVDPRLAHDTDGTVKEARMLFAALKRPNIMIKVPATPAGIPAIETLIGEGININVTLMFSLKHYDDVAGAYIRGLKKAKDAGHDLAKIASVASFFVSRVDAKVDAAIDELGTDEALSLRGKVAIANAMAAYDRFQETFSGDDWDELASAGAMVQRPLWASTSTKDPSYPDTLYVDTLIAAHTVNTVPPKTLDAFMDHGTAEATLIAGIEDAKEQLEMLEDIGISLSDITDNLQEAGVDSFEKSFDSLLASINEKKQLLTT